MTVLSLVLPTVHCQRRGQVSSSIQRRDAVWMVYWDGEADPCHCRNIANTLLDFSRGPWEEREQRELSHIVHINRIGRGLFCWEYKFVTCLSRTSVCCIGVHPHGHEEVESSLPALLMERRDSIQTGDRPWIHVLLPYRDPGTPVSVLSEGVKCILVQEPILKRWQ